jgi:transposase-like protein
MASAKKSKARRWPVPAAQKGEPNAPSPAMVSGAPPLAAALDPEVRERAARRRFTAEYKAQVLREADQCVGAGELGALLRREALYSSHLTTWRRQREHGALAALAPQKRGRPRAPASPLARRVAELERDKVRLERRLKQAEAIIDAQKKLAEILGLSLSETNAAGSTS